MKVSFIIVCCVLTLLKATKANDMATICQDSEQWDKFKVSKSFLLNFF